MLVGASVGGRALLRTGAIRLSRLACVDSKVTPVPPSNETADKQLRVLSAPSTVVSTARALPLPRPSLVTFDAHGTLLAPSKSVGSWYRHVLDTHCHMQRLPLPGPELFTAAFTKAYSVRCMAYPCFGASAGMSARDWWFEVVKQTYLTTEDLVTVDADELAGVLPAVFETLYTEVFGTAKGWTVKDDTLYTLQKLRGWRDEGAGPRLGVISDADDRLNDVLAELGIAQHLDFVLTSYASRSEKPSRGMFDQALALAGADATTAYHVGDSLRRDVAGAVGAGWTGLRYRERRHDDLSDWGSVDERPELRGRRDAATGAEWTELRGLADLLACFGIPDHDKPLP